MSSPLTFASIDDMVFHILTNRKTGFTIAAPEWDEDYQVSGGYQYVWPRDFYKVRTEYHHPKVLFNLKKALQKW